jgi:hypothetical protein
MECPFLILNVSYDSAEKCPEYSIPEEEEIIRNNENPIFSGGYNGWKIVETISRPGNDPFDISAVKQEVLSGIATRMAEAIFENGCGVIMTEDKQAHGYYLVEWYGLPYRLQRRQ